MTSGPLTTEPDLKVCAACPHPRDRHDTIATRFCTATVTGGFSRGCVCTAYADDTEQEPTTTS
jgi:hypothetical protein